MRNVSLPIGLAIFVMLSFTSSMADESESSLGSKVNEAWGEVKSGSQEALQGVSESSEELLEAAKESGVEVWEATKKGVGVVRETIVDAISGEKASEK